jgi:hypothetical protein
MINVIVPDEWSRKKKIISISIMLITITTILLILIN